MRLTSKYAPTQLPDFIGLDEPKKIIGKWLSKPYAQSFLFVGDSGTGKTTMGEAIARSFGINIDAPDAHFSFIHVASQKCNAAVVEEIQDRTRYAPWAPFWVILVDEADQMSPAAQIAFLSLLDRLPPRCVIIFTCNDTARLEDRFLSRCAVVKFSNYGLNEPGSKFLASVWERELASGTEPTDVAPLFKSERPDFKRIMKDQKNNLRGALMFLENQLMSA